MGKPTGFLEYKRINAPYRPVHERIADWNEVSTMLSEAALSCQAARCMDCGIPYCHAMGCPLLNLIPEFNDAVYRGRWHEAFERLELTNNFPEITGRVCPAPCEASCTLAINTAAVAIKQIELAIAERAFAEGWVVPRIPLKESGKKVAVIGSGPAGLAAAQQLRRKGHEVIVFEKSSRIGGILRYGIPDFKLEKKIIDRRLAQMETEGVQFVTDVTIGEDISTRYLRRQFDAIVLCLGAGEPRDLNVPGRGLEGIYFAMDYLTQSNRRIAGEPITPPLISARGKVVLVIGGGDTGSDCVGTAIRQGALKVYQYEILPKPPECDNPSNPSWPYWPNILRTSSSHEEGCERSWGIMTKLFTGKSIRVERGHFVRVRLERQTNTGAAKMIEEPDSAFSLKLDMVVLAMGFLHVKHSKLLEELGITYDERGNIEIDNNYITTQKGVFAAGDAVTGASLVVRAIYQGRQVAEAVHRYLTE